MIKLTRLAPLVFAISSVVLAGCPTGDSAIDPKAPSAATEDKDRNATADAPHSPGSAKQEAASQPDAKTGHEKPKPVDPVTANGKIFEGWPVPKLAVVLTGEQDGYIEPCGCQGRENQLGGIARRFSFLHDLQKKEWPTLAVDLGGLVNRFGRQAEIKYQITADAMNAMGYKAVGFGPKDLRLPAEALVAVTSGEANPFVSANVNLFDLTQPLRVLEVGGKKIGITSVLGDKYQAEINNDQLTLSSAQTALENVLPKLKAQNCDLLILLAHAAPAESEELAKRFPDFDVVATAGGAEEPPHLIKKLDGQKTVFVEVGHKGKYAIVLGLYDNAKEPWRYQRVPLDARFPDAPEMQKLMVAYQDQLEQDGFAGLGLRPKTHPRATQPGDPSGEFVGAAKCGECHKTAFGIWSKTKHAHATESLATSVPPRLHDPECISCHATGWSPQEYLPFATGFASLTETPQLAGNGCENCHGPGGGHVAAEAGRDLVRRDQMRQAMRLTKATVKENLCMKCHDGDNDPHFVDEFERYWPKIEHKGMK
ncbi:MAG TPA: multiheme c-type cytochrome [Pirellulales bacterium]|nr:multiheme c-type cytochrome [Pirellulales bacterium]